MGVLDLSFLVDLEASGVSDSWFLLAASSRSCARRFSFSSFSLAALPCSDLRFLVAADPAIFNLTSAEVLVMVVMDSR